MTQKENIRVYTHNWGDHHTVYINSPEGFCKLNVYQEPHQKVAELYDMIVYPEHRGKGHGRAILAAAVNVAENILCDVVVLWPVNEGWIQSWYKRNGFDRDYRFRNYERTPGWSRLIKLK